MQNLPLTRDLVLLGGGHAHALVLRAWAMNPLPGARLTLVDPNPVAPYTGMLPAHVAGHYRREQLEMDLVRLARRVGARLVLGRGTGIDFHTSRVRLQGGGSVGFDVLSVDIGITSDLPDLPGYAQHGIAAKPLGRFAERWSSFVAQVEAGTAKPEVAIIGAGVAGVELALSIAHRLRHVPGRKIALIERAAEALAQTGSAARRRLLGHLAREQISLHLGAEVSQIDAGGVRLRDGGQIAANVVLAAAGSRPQGWLAQTGLELFDGFIAVGETLQSHSHPQVFAAGDCAHLAYAPRPKAGVFAVRQAPILYHNLRAALSGGGMRAYRPQKDYLKLISLGDRRALAEKWRIPVEGRGLWWLKDRIDARFMRRFHDLPAMPPPAVPSPAALGLSEAMGTAPMCGGCGAKVGAGVLRAALPPQATAEGLETGGGDDAAVLRFGAVRQVLSTDHLRALTNDHALMAQIAAVHALGDIWAMGAKPHLALANLTLPQMSEPLQARTLDEIMIAATAVFAAEGAVIAGGHTAMGAELQIGFVVTGLAEGAVCHKHGARPGDALILTKPLGSGTLLAAEMALAAQARDIAALWQWLVQPQSAAARLLAPVAHAMTDVTGFGLAGHLDEMLRPDGLGATIELSDLPVMAGAEGLAAAGWASTLAPANRAALLGRVTAPASARAALLFDPQTSGGLLAAVPAQLAQELVTKLRALGFEAAQIGHVRDGQGGQTILAR
jgi:selenide, water dikinase